jgi:hypothetical protein
MKPHFLFTAAALLTLASAAFAQAPQSGSNVGVQNSGSPVQGPGTGNPSGNAARDTLPSTGTSGDTAGSLGTSPRSSESSVGTSGAVSGAGATGPSTGRCDTLIGDERARCMREQASTGTGAGTAGPGSTGMGR